MIQAAKGNQTNSYIKSFQKIAKIYDEFVWIFDDPLLISSGLTFADHITD